MQPKNESQKPRSKLDIYRSLLFTYKDFVALTVITGGSVLGKSVGTDGIRLSTTFLNEGEVLSKPSVTQKELNLWGEVAGVETENQRWKLYTNCLDEKEPFFSLN